MSILWPSEGASPSSWAVSVETCSLPINKLQQNFSQFFWEFFYGKIIFKSLFTIHRKIHISYISFYNLKYHILRIFLNEGMYEVTHWHNTHRLLCLRWCVYKDQRRRRGRKREGWEGVREVRRERVRVGEANSDGGKRYCSSQLSKLDEFSLKSLCWWRVLLSPSLNILLVNEFPDMKLEKERKINKI